MNGAKQELCNYVTAFHLFEASRLQFALDVNEPLDLRLQVQLILHDPFKPCFPITYQSRYTTFNVNMVLLSLDWHCNISGVLSEYTATGWTRLVQSHSSTTEWNLI